MLALETFQLQSLPWGELAGTFLRPHQTVQRTSLRLQRREPAFQGLEAKQLGTPRVANCHSSFSLVLPSTELTAPA